MSLDDFTRLKVIGKGSYGEVWLTTYKKDRRKQYVLKKMNLQRASKRERKSAEQEAKLLSKLKHPNIVSYKDSFETENGYLYIAMQYCEGGDLYNKLKEQKGVPLEERQVVEWFIQISMALQYLHERNILHRDLKTQNIFLTKSKIIKIGDLGIARVLESANDMASTLIGTPYYMSPELFANKHYNHKSDVWALGCCVYEMATLKHAFNAKDMNALVYKILKGKMPLMPKKYSVELVNLIRQMLHQDPAKRPSVNKILRDSYIKKNIAVFLEDTKKSRRPSSAGRSRPSSASSARSVSSITPLLKSIPSSNSELSVPCPSSASVASQSALPPPRASPSSYSKPPLAQEPPRLTPSSEEELPRSAPCQISKPSVSEYYNKLESVQEQPRSAYNKPLSIPDDSRSGPSSYDTPPSRSDEVDSVYINHVEQAAVYNRPAESGDGVRTNLSRKSSRSDLEPIEEKVQVPQGGDMNANCFDDDDQSSLKTDEKKKKGDTTPKKKAFLRNRIKSKSEGDDKSDADSITSVKSSRSIFSNPKPVVTPRPLPTPPVKVVESVGLPQRRNGDKSNKEPKSTDSSSGVSSSKEDVGGDVDTPVHSSLPNLSARERRRLRDSQTSASSDNHHLAKIKLRRPPERRLSEKVTRSEKKQVVVQKIVDPKKPTRQPSINDDSSSSSEELLQAGDSKEIAKRRETKEMNNFITLLNTTLLQEKEKSDEDDEEAETLKPIEEIEDTEVTDIVDHPASNNSLKPNESLPIHKSMSMPSIETLSDNSRLMKRIQQLHTDCVKGVGYAKVKEAYHILNRIEEDEVEPKLVALLGKDKFDEYAGKIWQLKFCEESLFLSS
ncbi:serine/threonine-protein kinase Nek4 isoform X2 [Patella vulgata]|uniref:serine/threonine-protein kinase Nek4 isoform X2 n=1 Tax=Patella vulgata TaxID=6465 RepID=UPI00217F6FFF|nr:serine/threonine-protein kinase Nek4 isoform X2 [Patella vulgata]